MNAKQELAGRVLMLVYDEIKPDTQRILDILAEYKIDHSLGIEEMDFARQIIHFLGAKKSEGLAKSSTYNYRMYLNMFAEYIGKSAAEITTNDIRDFIAYLGDTRKMKTVSIQAVLSILRSFFGWMNIKELIAKNPTARIKSFNIDKNESRHPLTTEQFEKLRDVCNTYREKALVEFFYSSGCRLSEAVQIDLCDVNFEKRSAAVVGKGNKRRTLFFSVRAKLMIQQLLGHSSVGTTETYATMNIDNVYREYQKYSA